MRRVSILGATGTIGCNTLDIIAAHPGRFSVAALTAQDNVEKLAAQARTFGARYAAIANPAHYNELKSLLAGTNIEVAAGPESVLAAAEIECEVVMSAIVGVAGLAPTLAAICKGRRIALANKECLVCAGEMMNAEVEKYGATLIPVDSEHSGIFQLLPINYQPSTINTITLTASGGPFRDLSAAQLKMVTPEQAVKHPNWQMGAKISVDSATLMNKGLELIEAHYLFGLPPDKLAAVIHPQSIVHALVAMVDGSVLAQLSNPDMRAPIAYALSYPERIATPVKPLDLAEIGNLSFAAPDEARFPALRLAKQALEQGGSAPTVLNAANEIAVARFLSGAIGFTDIPSIVEKALESLPHHVPSCIGDIYTLDSDTRRFAEAA
ncbi:MAG: 1-deoxy-D-xylulose-5-phosphate reductoisomerase [Alphaproteobacteria bacterium]|nr:1-deoxy-D-xylulose-5-phosphate reductoisomerase [Alphaproteobacteria bacterium]